MKYETIGSDQVLDIMEGREPRIPEEWDNPDDKNNKSNVKKKSSRKTTKNTIGRPVKEH